MATKHMKRCSASLATTETQTRTLVRDHCVLVRTSKEETLTYWQYQVLARMWSNGNSWMLMLGRQSGVATLRDAFSVSYAGNYMLTVGNSNPTSGVYPREMKMCVHTKTCTWILVVALLLTAGNNPNIFQWVNGWTDRGDLDHGILLSHERNKLLIHTTSQMNLKALQSERGQSPKVAFCLIPSTGPTYHHGKQISGCQGLWVEEVCLKGMAGGRFWSDITVL